MNKEEPSMLDLQGFLNDVSTGDEDGPSNLSFLYHLFASEFSMTLKDIHELPMPYLMNLVETQQYLKKEEEKAYKKANKR